MKSINPFRSKEVRLRQWIYGFRPTRNETSKDAPVVLLLRFLTTQKMKIKDRHNRESIGVCYEGGVDENGKIEKFECIKECPCFDAIPEFERLRK